jgi:beta-glucosidase
LLKNDNILPLDKKRQILIAGFGAHSKYVLNGPWTLDWQGAPENSQPEDMTTLYEAMQQIFGTAYVSLFDKEIKDEQAEQEFILATKDADYIVLTVGEEPYSEFKGNINDLTISVKHQKYIQLALLSGKPVILVLLEGRPRLITKWEKYMSAIVFAGYPGYFGGLSLADLISGKVNPSGRLAFSYPRFCQHNTPYYVKKSDAYNPLYPFGHGISYTQFKVTDLKISDTLITDKEVKPEVVAQVRNVGKRAGKFAALWYVNDKYGTITRPKKMLKHYEKILIKPGEMHTFRWKIDIEKDFSYPQKDGTWIIEPGTFEICLENKTVTVNYLTEDE